MSNTAKSVGSTPNNCQISNQMFWALSAARCMPVTGIYPGVYVLFSVESRFCLQKLEGMAGWKSRPQPNCTVVSLGKLYILEWLTQPCWLTFNNSWLRNVVPSHSHMCPGWWQYEEEVPSCCFCVWIHTTRAHDSVKWIKCKNCQYLFFPNWLKCFQTFFLRSLIHGKFSCCFFTRCSLALPQSLRDTWSIIWWVGHTDYIYNEYKAKSFLV